MDYTSKTRSLQSLVKDINKGAINLSHKLQQTCGKPTPLGVGWIAHLFYNLIL